MSTASETTVQAVRRFNRFYTAAIGTLEEGLLQSPLTLAEARLLFEIATTEKPIASDIAARMRLDMGYLSRLLKRFEERGLIRRTPSIADGRQSIIALTAVGRKQFAALDRRSTEQVSAMLEPLAPVKQRTLVQAMNSIETIFRGEETAVAAKPFLLRTHRAGDMGWIVHRHGALYAQEYGWNDRLEALVARVTADFIEQFDPAKERCWIAERDGEFLGCVFLIQDRTAEKTAKLRLLLVEPNARGLGVGRTLVQQCTQFGRQAGYSRITLWTHTVLSSARHIYEREGYKLVKEEEHDTFGIPLMGQYWELQL